MTDSNNQAFQSTLWITWGALLFSLVMYLVVLIILSKSWQGSVTANSNLVSMLRIPLGVVSVVTIGIIFALRNALFFKPFQKITAIAELHKKYFTICILSWALCESVAIYGFVLSFLSHDLMYYLIFAAVAVLFDLVFRPQLKLYQAALKPGGAAPEDDDPMASQEW